MKGSEVVVERSGIEGFGVFAAVAFSAGEVILAIDDSHVVDGEHSVPKGERKYCDCPERGTVVQMQIPEHYINHSCDPNVYVRTCEGVRQVVAIRDIEAAQEITYDYLRERVWGRGWDMPLWCCPLLPFNPFRLLSSAAITAKRIVAAI